MTQEKPTTDDASPRTVSERDLPMLSRFDPEALAQEKALLRKLESKPLFKRMGGYFKLSGPGWLQSALTLGGGSAGSSLFAGALMGYTLLWVQPFAMFLGVIMMSALAYQTLTTQKRPFQAVNTYAHPVLGWGWALASLLASIVWSFPQFNLAGSVIGDMFTAGRETFPQFAVNVGRYFEGAGATPAQAASAFYAILSAPIIVLITLYVTWNYSKGSRGVRWFENVLKLMVAGIVICFAIVAFKTGINWGELFKGFTRFHVPRGDIDKLGVLIAMSATAVGINMTFLFPYTVLARGWGREHRGLAKFDLGIGMLVPFVLATTFVIVSSANVLHPELEKGIAEIKANDLLTAEEQAGQIAKLKGSMRGAVTMSKTLEPFLGRRLSHFIFGLGIIGMTVSSIVMLMLVSGFIMTEVCGAEPYGTAYKIGVLMPVTGFLGPILWGKMAFWLVVPTSIICFFFLPIAYVAFFVMMNSKGYLGADRPAGAHRVLWNVGMGAAILVVGAGGAYMIYTKLLGWLG